MYWNIIHTEWLLCLCTYSLFALGQGMSHRWWPMAPNLSKNASFFFISWTYSFFTLHRFLSWSRSVYEPQLMTYGIKTVSKMHHSLSLAFEASVHICRGSGAFTHVTLRLLNMPVRSRLRPVWIACSHLWQIKQNFNRNYLFIYSSLKTNLWCY